MNQIERYKTNVNYKPNWAFLNKLKPITAPLETNYKASVRTSFYNNETKDNARTNLQYTERPKTASTNQALVVQSWHILVIRR